MIIVDTSAWIYLFQKKQSGVQQRQAKEFYHSIEEPLFVTDLIIEETHKWLVHHGNPPTQCLEIAKGFINQQFAQIIPLDDADRFQSLIWVEKYLDHNLSYTDAITIAVMKRLGIRKIFTFDHHFDLIKGIEKVPR